MTRSRLRLGFSLFVVAVCAVTTLILSTGASAHRFAGCTPQALTPSVSGGRGFARAQTSGCNGISYSWQVRLSTAGGTVLATNSGTSSADQGFTAPGSGTVVCVGNSVHSFITINVGGTNKSDTSGNVAC